MHVSMFRKIKHKLKMTDEKKSNSNFDLEAASSSLRNSNAKLSVQVTNSLEIEGTSKSLLESASDEAVPNPDTVEVYGYLRLLPVNGTENLEAFKRSSMDFGFPGKLRSLAKKMPTLPTVKKKAEVRKSAVSQTDKNEFKSNKNGESVLSTIEGVKATKSVIVAKPRTVKLVNQPESKQKLSVKKVDPSGLNLKKSELKSRLLTKPESKLKATAVKVPVENEKLQVSKRKALFSPRKVILGKKENVPKVISSKQSSVKPPPTKLSVKTTSKVSPSLKKDLKLPLKRQSIKMVPPVISDNLFRKDSSSSAIANVFTTLSRSLSGLLESEFLSQKKRQDQSLTRQETKSILSEPNNFYLKSKSRHLLSSSDAESSSIHELLSESSQLPSFRKQSLEKQASKKELSEKQGPKKSFISKLGKSIKSSSYQSLNNLSASFLKSQSSASLVSKASENAESKQSKSSSINTVLKSTWKSSMKSLSRAASKPSKVTSKIASKLSATFLDSGSTKKSKGLSSSVSYDSKLSEAFLSHKSELDLTKSAANESSILGSVGESFDSSVTKEILNGMINDIPHWKNISQKTAKQKIIHCKNMQKHSQKYFLHSPHNDSTDKGCLLTTSACPLLSLLSSGISIDNVPNVSNEPILQPYSSCLEHGSSILITGVSIDSAVDKSSWTTGGFIPYSEPIKDSDLEFSNESVLRTSVDSIKDPTSTFDIEQSDTKLSKLSECDVKDGGGSVETRSSNSDTEPLNDPVSDVVPEYRVELSMGIDMELSNELKKDNELFVKLSDPARPSSDNLEAEPKAALDLESVSFGYSDKQLLQPGSDSAKGIVVNCSSDPSVESSGISVSNLTNLERISDFSSSESNLKLQSSILNSVNASLSRPLDSFESSASELDISFSKLASESLLDGLSKEPSPMLQTTPDRLNTIASTEKPKSTQPTVKSQVKSTFVKRKPFCNYDNSHLNSVNLEEVKNLEVIRREPSVSESSDFEALAAHCFRSSLREKCDDNDSIQVEEIIEPLDNVLFETKPWIEMINTDKDHVTNEWKYYSRPLESGLRVSDNRGLWNKHIPDWSPEKGVLIKLPLKLNSAASLGEESVEAEVERVSIQLNQKNDSNEDFSVTLLQDSKPTLKKLNLKPLLNPKQSKRNTVSDVQAAVQQIDKAVPKPGSQFLKKLKSTLNSKPPSPTKNTAVLRKSLLTEPVLKIVKAEPPKSQPKRSTTLLKASKKVESVPKNLKNEVIEEVVEPKPKKVAAKSKSVADVVKRPDANEKRPSLKLPFTKMREATPSKSLLKKPIEVKQSAVSKERSVGSKDSRLRTFSELNKIAPKGLRKKPVSKKPATSKEKMRSTPVLQSELSKPTRQASLDSLTQRKSSTSLTRQKSLNSLTRQNNFTTLSKQDSVIKKEFSNVGGLSRQATMSQILTLSRQASFNRPLKHEKRQASFSRPQRSKSRDSSSKENDKENSVLSKVHKLLSSQSPSQSHSNSQLHSHSSHSKSLTPGIVSPNPSSASDPTELSCSEQLLQSFRQDSAAQMFSQSSHNTKKTHSSIWFKTEKSDSKEEPILKDESADESNEAKENRLFSSSPLFSNRTELTDIKAVIKKFNVENMTREELLEFIDYLAKNSTYKPVKEKSIQKEPKIVRPSLNLQRVLNPDFNDNVFCFVTDKDGYLKKVLRSVYPENRKPPSKTKIYEGSIHFDTPYRNNESTLASTTSTPPSSVYACDIFHCCSTSVKKKDERTRKRNKSRRDSRSYNQLVYVTKGPLHVTGHPQIRYSEYVSNYPSSYNSEKKATVQESAKWRVARSPVYGKSINLNPRL